MDEILEWLEEIEFYDAEVEVASEDASFRRYFRLTRYGTTFILMDASREKEALGPFIDVTNRLLNVGVHVPKIYNQSLEKGYLIIEDLGSRHYLDILNDTNYESLYMKAIEEILLMQQADPEGLPLYDKAFLQFEMDLMPEWFLTQYLEYDIDESTANMIDESLALIADEVLKQPQGYFVHRDFHSRNLLLTPKESVGVIDYQDAMNGAVTYDLVSLLKDCYVRFDRHAIERLALHFRDLKKIDVDDATFLRWFDFMGLQRHIKVLGIFCRLYLRDGKPGYLEDLPLTLHYVLEALGRYSETQSLYELMQKLTLPSLEPR